MSQGLRTVQSHDVAAELEAQLFSRLAGLLRSRSHGHCMRIADLDSALMARLCARLRIEVPEAQVVILGNGHAITPPELTVSATKLVELRNPVSDGTQRPPLLVFIPNEIRAAAEDSFGVATFEDIPVGDVYKQLRGRLIEELPSQIKGAVAEGLRRLEGDDPWPFADPLAIVRFLLTAKLNDGDPEAVGAALFELALVPDFELLLDPTKTPSRITRNRDCVRRLTWSHATERGRVLDLGLKKGASSSQLANFLAQTGLEDPYDWTRRIVLDRACWKFAFHRWEFQESKDDHERIFIGNVQASLPIVGESPPDSRLEQLNPEERILVVGPGGLRKFNVGFQVNPHPSRVQGLDRFVAQVISRATGPVGLVRSKKAWSTNRTSATIDINNLSKVNWEEGWHFIRILAQTEDGDLIPLVDERDNPLPWSVDDSDGAIQRPNESELFYVVTELDEPPPPPQRALTKHDSLEHARLYLRFSSVQDGRDPNGIGPQGARWSEGRQANSSGRDTLEISFGHEGNVQIPISRTLKTLEQAILSASQGPLSWRVSLRMGQADKPTGNEGTWPTCASCNRFLEARSAWFDVVRSGAAELITQAADFLENHPLAIEYADAYRELLKELLSQASGSSSGDTRVDSSALGRFLTLDTVSLTILDYRGHRREAALLAPTHPLRVLWWATWARTGESWVEAAKDSAAEFVGPTRDALLNQVVPIGHPPVLSTMPSQASASRLLIPIDNIAPFWSLYAPAQEPDPRGLLGDVCSSFGLPEPAIGGSLLDGKALATRVQRYLIQHPYISTLVINAFNPGRAGILADMLLTLQGQPAFDDISYDIRIFVVDSDAPGVGEGLADLLSPSGTLAGREADAFITSSGDHLHPKLALAIRSTNEFRAQPESFSAHLSFLFDLFPAEEVGAEQATLQDFAAPIHGLLQDYQVEYKEDESTVAWCKTPRHGSALPLSGSEKLTELLSTVPAILSSAISAVATGQFEDAMRPVIGLALDAKERALLHQVHEVSDWVVTLDRNMGIEFFDHGGQSKRPDYLIDHSPDIGNAVGHRLTITSRSVSELEALLVPVLNEYGLPSEGRHAIAILDQLRSLSGRLALKLISAPSQRAEALGLALSRIYLWHQEALQSQITLSLDAHLELYRSLKKAADELGDEVSFKRTDLALFDLNAAERTITCRLVEVKCYAAVGDLAAYSSLKDKIAEQIAQSEQVLSLHFNPHRNNPDRADRLVKSQELVSLLEFYLDRGVRYNLMESSAVQEARFFLRSLEDGYRLAFTRSALIFDFEKTGSDIEQENGIEFHRVGSDLIRELIEAAATSPPEQDDATEAQNCSIAAPLIASADIETTRLQRRRSIPELETAAFLGQARDRSVSWQDLASTRRQSSGLSAAFPLEPQITPKNDDDDLPPRSGGQLVSRKPDGTPPGGSPIDSASAQHETSRDVISVQPIDRTDESPVSIQPAIGCEPTIPLDGEPNRTASLHQVIDQKHGNGAPACDVMLGVTGDSPQYGLLGEVSGRKVALDLNQTHTISLFGVQGGGKSYTLGSVAEMASLPIDGINLLPQPLATVIFHYSPTMDYAPEFTSMVAANSDAAQIALLREKFGAEPKALSDVLLLVPSDKLDERQKDYPGIEVRALRFAANELQASHWRFLLGAVGNQATYIRQLNMIMKQLRDELTLEGLRHGIADSRMPDHIKDLAYGRLELAQEFIDDSVKLGEAIRPGRLVIVDLRDEFMEKDQALGLFVVLLQLFAEATYEGSKFNKLVVFDEAHKYIDSPDLVGGLIEVVREMRHKGTSVMVASQDPPSVPVALIELSSQIILHKFNSPAWLKHIQKANAALGDLTPEKMAHLQPGEAYVWSSKATDSAFSKGAIKVRCRPRVTQHGGSTKTAV